ncbi:MAG: hypothetical protein EOP34_06740, partial [Rickettsiales bacterium]
MSHTEDQNDNTKDGKSNTNNKGWTIKGIEIETRIALSKAAKKEGMTIGKYCNIKLREAAHNSLKAGSDISVISDDIKEEVRAQIDDQINGMRDELQLIIKSEIEKV